MPSKRSRDSNIHQLLAWLFESSSDKIRQTCRVRRQNAEKPHAADALVVPSAPLSSLERKFQVLLTNAALSVAVDPQRSLSQFPKEVARQVRSLAELISQALSCSRC